MPNVRHDLLHAIKSVTSGKIFLLKSKFKYRNYSHRSQVTLFHKTNLEDEFFKKKFCSVNKLSRSKL